MSVIRIFMDDGGTTFEWRDPFTYGSQCIGIVDEEEQFEGFGERLSWPMTTYAGEPWRNFTQEEYDALPEGHEAREWGRDGYIYCPGVWRQTTAADLIALKLVAP